MAIMIIYKIFASRKCPLMYNTDSSSSWLIPYEYMFDYLSLISDMCDSILSINVSLPVLIEKELKLEKDIVHILYSSNINMIDNYIGTLDEKLGAIKSRDKTYPSFVALLEYLKSKDPHMNAHLSNLIFYYNGKYRTYHELYSIRKDRLTNNEGILNIIKLMKSI